MPTKKRKSKEDYSKYPEAALVWDLDVKSDKPKAPAKSKKLKKEQAKS